MAGFLSKLLTLGEGKQLKHYEATAAKINGPNPRCRRALTRSFARSPPRSANAPRTERDLKSLLPEAFAAVREASVRTLGLRHFDVQLIGGMALNDGQIAEMKTGEGKTLVSTLAGYLNALPGNNVHVVTVNDYLARRDSEWMGQVYRFPRHGGGPHPERHAPRQEDTRLQGGCHLRHEQRVRLRLPARQHGDARRGPRAARPPFAIVDEVDSILIDEARTPLIISGSGHAGGRDVQ